MREKSSPQASVAQKQPRGRTGLGCSMALAIGLIVLLAGAGLSTPRLLSLLNSPADAAPVTIAAGPSADLLAQRRTQEQNQLESYGWVDKANNTAHIPIERAIELVAAQGLPVGNAGASAQEAAADTGGGQSTAADLSNVSYDDVQPIFEQHCAECHGADDPEEGLQVTTYKGIMAGSIYGSVVKPNDPAGSYLLELVSTGQMPKKGEDLSPEEIALITAWINNGLPEHASGASASAAITSTTGVTNTVAITDATTAATESIDLSDVNYQDNILPLFQEHCAECHGDDDPEEGLQVTTYKALMAGSIYGAVVKPGDPDNSYLVEMVSTGQMPKKGAKLTPPEVEMIVAWIKAGAPEFGQNASETAPVDSSHGVTATEAVTGTESISTTSSISSTAPISPTGIISPTESMSATAPINAGTDVTASGSLSVTEPISVTEPMTASDAISSTAEVTQTTTATNSVDLANVSFEKDVLPIFQERCSKCHGDDEPEEGLVLTSYKDVMLGSIYGAVVKPSEPDDSYLVEMVSTGQMPKRGDDLTPAQVETIIAWIQAGALDN